VELARVASLCLHERVLQLTDESQKTEISLHVAAALALLQAPVDVHEKQRESDSVHAPSRLVEKADRSRQEALEALQQLLDKHPEFRSTAASEH
jgi:hypothetical protein